MLTSPRATMLLHHLSYQHPGEVGSYLARMHIDEDITAVVLEAFEVVEGKERRTHDPTRPR